VIGALFALAATSTGSEAIVPKVSLEYRVEVRRMDPLSLNDLSAPEASWYDQRLRLGAEARFYDRVRVTILADILDGVLFGDNGSFVGSPKRNRGSFVGARTPNLARLEVDRIRTDLSPLDRSGYGLVLKEAQPITVRELYGEALLPIGLLRAGRQPIGSGRSVLVHEGTRINRWGVSRGADALDALTFGTKLSAIFDAIQGEEIDPSPDRGLFLAALFGQVVEQQPQLDDDLIQWVLTTFFLAKNEELFGVDVDRLKSGLVLAQRRGDLFESVVTTLTAYLDLERGPLRLSLQHVQMFGGTKEVSEGLAALGTVSGAPALQDIRAFGGFAEIAWAIEPIELVFELFYASGDEDPRSTTPITQLTFAEDTNVGLHLFENVLAYESARSARLGVVNLNAVAPPSHVVAEVDTRGGLTNAIVLFPQITASPLPWLSARAGVMFAFAAVKTVDPIGTILAADGIEIADDAVNFHGGKPAKYWGTEIDLGLTLSPIPGFQLDLEGACLFPGDGLRDENGDAVRSFFIDGRLTFFYD
jgi:hypothetical protein